MSGTETAPSRKLISFLQNYRVYILATVSYMGALLFGTPRTP